MNSTQVTHRLLSMRSGLAVRRIRSGEIHDDEFTPAKNKAALQADAGESIFVLDGVRDVRERSSDDTLDGRQSAWPSWIMSVC